jgi:CubicO group peptidase (beta-lactamase class C family)
MKRFAITSLATLMICAAWAGIVYAALDRGWGLRPIAEQGDTQAFLDEAKKTAATKSAGNLALVLIEDGERAGDFQFSKGDPVDGDALFQVASLGKWLTAWGVMVLVEDGSIDLDAPVSQYLTRWQWPASEFDTSQVTVRRLLSHKAGLSDGLGYDGFATPAERQTLEQSLTRAGDASPGKDGRVVLGSQPGSGWEYSGGGYTVLQLLVEEVSGQDFANFMQNRVFRPLGMSRSTFDHERALELGVAQNFRSDGGTEHFRWYTALAATSLFTTANDLARFLEVQAPGRANPVLGADSMTEIATPHASQMGEEIWGLGAMLYAPNNAGGYVLGHDGSNGPAINTAARIDPSTGDGIVILSTGHTTLATELAGEWVFWKTGNVDTLSFLTRMPIALTVVALGWFLIIAIAIFLAVRARRSRSDA